jgi:hypothetical protein
MVAVEIQGGAGNLQGHFALSRWIRDQEKYHEAQIDGWIVLQFTLGQMETGYSVALVARAIQARRAVLIEPPPPDVAGSVGDVAPQMATSRQSNKKR